MRIGTYFPKNAPFFGAVVVTLCTIMSKTIKILTKNRITSCANAKKTDGSFKENLTIPKISAFTALEQI